MTWNQLLDCFLNSGSKPEKVLLLSANGDLHWLDPETASATGAVGRVRAVQGVTVGADSSRITWRVRLCPSGALRDTSTRVRLNLRLLKRVISMMSSSQGSTASRH